MKITIDIKSALLGMFIGVVLMFTVGAGTSGTSSSDIGRYRITSGGNYVFIVDTTTGEAWAHESTTEGLGAAKYKKWWDPKL